MSYSALPEAISTSKGEDRVTRVNDRSYALGH